MWGCCETDLSGLTYGPLICRDRMHHQTLRQDVNISYCEHEEQKRVSVMPGGKKTLTRRRAFHMEQVGGGSKKPWRRKCDIKNSISSEHGEPRSGPRCSTATPNVVRRLMQYYIDEPPRESPHNNRFLSGISCVDDTWINEPMRWRLKTECCVIGWLCSAFFSSLSYCHTDWMKARSDDIAAGSDKRVYPLASRRDKGQWLWVHRERECINISPLSSFPRLYNHPFLPFIASINLTLPECFEQGAWKPRQAEFEF